MISRLLDISPRKVLRKLGFEKLITSKSKNNIASNFLKRRFEGGQLKGFHSNFFVKRDALLKPLMKEVMNAGRLENSFLLRPELSELDERIVEYPIALINLLHASDNRDIHVLDVGCVLNNLCIADYISDVAQMIWFLNPSVEPLQYKDNVAYIVSDTRKHRLPASLTFDLVTCLSTLEHVGMDNTRYGGRPAEFKGHIEHPEKFAIETVTKLSGLVKSGGRFLLSVPFGHFEYLYIYGKQATPIYYTFNDHMLLALKNSLEEFDSKVTIYKVVPRKGWVKTSVDDRDILKYADNCAAAGAVAFIEAVRIDQSRSAG